MKEDLVNLVKKNKNFTRAIKSPANSKLLEWTELQPGNTLMEKIFNALNETTTPSCPGCEKQLELISLTKGYRGACSIKCLNEVAKSSRIPAAIEKINSFGNMKYISGYEHSHSLVTVQNTACGCTFDVNFNNLFSNPNYCPTHGRELKHAKLAQSNKNREVNAQRVKTRSTRAKKLRDEGKERVRLQNSVIENQVILSGDYLAFIDALRASHGIHAMRIIKSNFPKIAELIKNSNGEVFWERAYNLAHPNHDNSCKECGKPTNFNNLDNFDRGYFSFCSASCSAINKNTQHKLKKTSLEKYGVEHHLSSPSSKAKKIATNIEKYGVEHCQQNKDIHDKTMKSQFRKKTFVLPSGAEVQLMGYEPQVVEWLLQNFCCEDDLNFSHIPTIRYSFDGKNRWYFPDLYVPKENLIIEVKSDWTYNIETEKTKAKAIGTKDAGFTHALIIWDKKEEPKIVITEI